MGFEKVKDFFGFNEEFQEEEDLKSPAKPVIRSFKGAVLHSSSAVQKNKGMTEIKIEEPRIYEDSLNISTHLREDKPVIINLKYLDNDAGKRLIDFVCGTAYAINGHMLKIGENIFLFTPANVLISDSGEKTTLEQGIEQEEKEVFFKKVHTA